jgi:hypothetical protein
MLGANIIVVKSPRFLLGKRHDFPSTVGDTVV